MAVNLNNARIVVPKRRVVRVGGQAMGERESLTVEMRDQGLEDIRYLLKAITVAEVQEQERIGNEATRLAVDSREGKPLEHGERRTEVQFGNVLDMVMVKAVERELIDTIRRMTKRRTGALQNINNWEWVYYEGKGKRGRKINPRRLQSLPFNARLVLRPTDKIPYVAWANMRAARRGQQFTPSRGKNKGVSRTIYRGFMAESIAKLKRSQMMKNYTMWVSFSKKYRNDDGEKVKYPHGTPSIVIAVKRKRRGYRRFG